MIDDLARLSNDNNKLRRVIKIGQVV